MVRRDLFEYRRSVTWFGFNSYTGKSSAKAIFHSILIPISIIETGAFAFYNWNDMNRRVNGLKWTITSSLLVTYLCAVVFKWDESKRIFEIIEERTLKGYRHPFRKTPQRLDLECKLHDDVLRMSMVWHHLFFATVILVSTVPILILLFQLYHNNIHDITTDMLCFSVPLYVPEQYNTLSIYFLVYLFQGYFLIIAIRLSLAFIIAPFIAMKVLLGEQQLLRLSVDEMRNVIEYYNQGTPLEESHNILRPETDYLSRNEAALKDYLVHIVRCHVDIYRRLKQINEGIQIPLFSLHIGVAMMICMSIYTLVKGTEIMVKFQEVSVFINVMFCIYCNDSAGEKILNENENFRQALYDSSWVDKPLWYKKCMLIIISRTYKDITLNAGGIISLNLKSFVMALRLAYSLYNILNEFERRI